MHAVCAIHPRTTRSSSSFRTARALPIPRRAAASSGGQPVVEHQVAVEALPHYDQPKYVQAEQDGEEGREKERHAQQGCV